VNQGLNSSFFNNPTFDEPFNRFLLSEGGALLLSLIFISVVLLTMKIPDGAFKQKEENKVYHNPYLLITGVLAGIGGLLISSLAVLLWMLWVS
jgi:hypothetical protein